MMQTHHVAFVIPCYNEAARLDLRQIADLIHHDIALILVNDGSTDTTLDLLNSLQLKYPQNVIVYNLTKNFGKGEATRRGLCCGIDHKFSNIGFIDADFATPSFEAIRLMKIAINTHHPIVLASRIKSRDRNIERPFWRYYLGRIFARLASIVLKLSIMDTQCGCKVLKSSTALSNALALPFNSRWAFDVELLGRLLYGYQESDKYNLILEVPLKVWREIPHGKLGPLAMIKAGFSLLFVRSALRRFGNLK